jgi:hypothetical protein
MRQAHRRMRGAAKGLANMLGLRTPSRYRNERTRTNRGGGAAASAEQALAAEQAIERRRVRRPGAADHPTKPAPPKAIRQTPYGAPQQPRRQRRPRRLPETETQKAALAAFDSRIGQSYGDGPTARLRRRSEPSLKPSPRVKLAEPSGMPDDDKKLRRMPSQLNRRPPPPSTRRRSENDKPAKLCCDRCDGDHMTEKCPHFKKDRGTHPDATRMLGKKGKVLGGNAPPLITTRGRVVPQPPDGSCLFHSLSYGLREGNASGLRRELMQFIRKHPDLEIAGDPLRDWIRWDALVSVQKYADKMSRGGWGGGIEMAAFSELKGCNVEVYEQCSAGFKRISLFEKSGASRTVRVCYRGGVHYDALELR